MKPMHQRFVAAIALLVAMFLVGSVARAADYMRPGPYAITHQYQSWTDAARDRTLPIKLDVPVGASGPRPVIFFSHGLGGTMEAGTMWGDYWASYGFIVVHLQHPGSDDSVWKSVPPAQRMAAMKRAANAMTFMDRVKDVHFAIDELARRKTTDPELANADLSRVGMSGHSYGAVTTQAVSGERLPLIGQAYKDPRIKASIAFSPSARRGEANAAAEFGGITMPFFGITGTADTSPLDPSVTPESRQIPYKYMPPPNKCLLVLNGATHMVFGGGEGRHVPVPNQALMDTLIQAGSAAFWLAHLTGDAEARAWLASGPYSAAVGSLGAFASK